MYDAFGAVLLLLVPSSGETVKFGGGMYVSKAATISMVDQMNARNMIVHNSAEKFGAAFSTDSAIFNVTHHTFIITGNSA